MKRIGMVMLMTFCIVVSLQAENDDMTRLRKFFTNISAYNNLFTQEKVYLHLDNNGYFPDEKIWFKAYVFNAGSLRPTDLSKVLYVELLMPDGTVWERKTLPIYNGRTYGEFDLSDILRTGFYEIRAYTRAMTNWDGAYIYSRVFPVFDSPKDSTNFTPLDMNTSAPFFKNTTRRSAWAAPLLTPVAQKQKGHILSFFPESGNLTLGLPGRVAFKLTDERGLPLEQSFEICDNEDKVVCTASPVHEGMGLFELPADWKGGYASVSDKDGKQQRFPLPASENEGCTLRATTETDGSMTIVVAPNEKMRMQRLGISVTCRGQACYFDTIYTDRASIVKSVPRRQLHDGIQQVTLFTPEGRVLGERLVWVVPLAKPLYLQTKQSAQTYQPFSPIALEFTLQDHDGKPLQGDFSLSVQDRAGIVAGDEAGLRTDMLLCSDLKGYIHEPEHYLKADENSRRDLDLLLMVQGWRRYEWKQMAGVDTFQLKQPAEDRQIFDGWVVDWSKKRNYLSGLNVSMLLVRNDGFTSYAFTDTKSDAGGYFAFSPSEEIYGNLLVSLTATDANDKRKKSSILLNRNFSPKPQPYEYLQYRYCKSPVEVNIPIRRQPETFVWTDTIPGIHHLPPAKVTEKEKRFTVPFGTRWTYMGGENAARRSDCLYFDIEEELQQYLDSVGFEPNIYDWLEQVCPDFRHERDTPGKLTYRGRDVYMFYDNLKTPPANHTGNMSDFRSVFITNNPEAPNLFGEVRTNSSNVITVMFYSEVGNNFINTYKKGMRNTVLHGFSKVSDFYSPNYRLRDMPSPSDRRRTLFWSPSLTTDKEGHASVVFFNNSRKDTRIRIDAQGIAVNGELFSTEK